MPRVHFVRKARKDNPVAKRGESYYWWKFRYGPKRYSKTPPKPSDLTQSQYLTVIYSCQEQFSETPDPTQMSAEGDGHEAIIDALGTAEDNLSSIADELEELVSQYEESASNIEEHFQYSELAENLRTAGDECQTAVDDLRMLSDECRDAKAEVETIVDDWNNSDSDDEDEKEENRLTMVSDIDNVLSGISFDEPNFDFHEV